MRNLKKVLSLALALVMLLGMMMVGAGAATTGFGDDAQIKDSFKEAAAVNKALGLMEGDGTNLNPTANITRAEAFILSLRVDGSNANEIASKWPVSEKPFNDVTTGKWYAPYLAYGKEMGLIAGNNGSYNPDGNITVVEYSILLLGKLGFDPARYQGANWNTNAAADAEAAGLYEGLGVINYYTKQLTREEACQMVFNALFYSPSGSNGYVIVGGTPETSVVFSSILEAIVYQSNQSPKGDLKVSTANDTLAATVFKLAKTEGANELGQPLTQWTINGEKACVTESDSSAAKIYTKQVEEKDVAKDLAGYSVTDTQNSASVAINKVGAADSETDIVVKNGGEAESLGVNASTTPAAGIAGLTEDGVIVEVYASGKTITKIVRIEKTAAKLAAAPIEKDGKVTITTLGVSGRDAETVIGWEGLEKDDVVLFVDAPTEDGKITYIYRPEVITGATTGSHATKGALINGSYYKPTGLTAKKGISALYSAAMTNTTEYNYYLDDGGFIFYAEKAGEAAAVEQNYAVVLKTAWVLGNPTGDLNDKTGAHLQAQILKLDGTTEIVPVKDVEFQYATGKTTKVTPVAAETKLTDLGFVANDDFFVNNAAMATAITAADGTLKTGGAKVDADSAIEAGKFTAVSKKGGKALFDGSDVATASATSLVTHLYLGVGKNAGSEATLVTNGNFYSYTVDKDGNYSLSTQVVKDSGDTFAALAQHAIENKVAFDGTALGNNDTVFIYGVTADGKTTYTAYTGVANMPATSGNPTNNGTDSAASTSTIVKGANGIAKYVYVTTASLDTATTDVVYITDARGTAINGDKGVKGYLYSAIVNGEAKEIMVDSASKDAIDSNKTTFYTVTGVADDIYTLAVGSATSSGGKGTGTGITSNSGGVFTTDASGVKAFSYDEDAPAFYIDAEGSVSETTVAALSLDATDLVYVVASSGKASVVYVAERDWNTCSTLIVTVSGGTAAVDNTDNKDDLLKTNPVAVTSAAATNTVTVTIANTAPNMTYKVAIDGLGTDIGLTASAATYTLDAKDAGKTLDVTLEGTDGCSGATYVETYTITVAFAA